MNINYFDINEILKIHNTILEVSGGLRGYKDKRGITQVIDFVQNDIYYPDFIDKLSYIIFSISKNHFFNDGNKRTAIAVGLLFLIINEHIDKIDNYLIDMEIIIIEVVENKISRNELKHLLKKYL